MTTADHVVDDLTAPALPAATRLRLAAEHLQSGPTEHDSPALVARLAEVINGPGGDERVIRALYVYDTAAALAA
jgi:hypothetical protein